jgi:hypothetical protein
MIDNGLWEGQVVSNAKLLKLADYAAAEEIIAPDHQTGCITVKRTKKFLDYLEQKGRRKDFKIHGVVHGSKWSEQRKCLYDLLDLGVDIIDIPKWFSSKLRVCWVNHIREKGHDIPIHYLGFHAKETQYLSITKEVRSFDTSVPYKPKYGDKFNLDLPYSLKNRLTINHRVRAWKRLYG